MEMGRVAYLIDGFNLYHSVRRAQSFLNTSTKWLNIRKLCESYLHLYQYLLNDGRPTLHGIYYFSAIANHLDNSFKPNVTERQKRLLSCLEDTGVSIHLSRFKPKQIFCPLHHPGCQRRFIKHEEKETDVSIALKLVELLLKDECDLAVIVSGDTDLAPAISTANRLFPHKKIIFAFPAYRKSEELLRLAPNSFSINQKMYAKFQLPNPYHLSGGNKIYRPDRW